MSKTKRILSTPAFTLGLPFRQPTAFGLLFFGPVRPDIRLSFRIFRGGALIFSATGSDLTRLVEKVSLHFPSKARDLSFDLVVFRHVEPLTQYLVFPVSINVCWEAESNYYWLRFPGRRKSDWVVQLQAAVSNYRWPTEFLGRSRRAQEPVLVNGG